MQKNISDDNEAWTLTVKPKSGWFDLNFPELWRYRDLLLIFVKRDFSANYKQTILGPLWFFLQPLFTSLVFLFIQQVAHIGTDGIPSILFNLCGLMAWNYFSTCVNKTSTTFVGNSGIFGKVYFPRLITPLATVISNLVNFAMQFLLFVLFFMYYVIFKGYQVNINTHLLLLPLLVIIMAALGLGIGIIVSSLTTKYRDLSYLIGLCIQLLMYLSPTLYPVSLMKEGSLQRKIVLLNPMSSIIESFRYAFFSKGMFRWEYIGYSSAFALVVLVTGIILFNRTEKNFMDTV